MAMGGDLPVNWATQVEPVDDALRRHIEYSAHPLDKFAVGNFAGTVGFEHHTDRLRLANRIRHLQQTFARQTRLDHILGYVAGAA